jgi:fatty acid synthase
MRILQDDAVKPNVHTTSFVQRLTNYALLFSGQSTPWRTVLQAYSSDRKLYEHLQQIEKKVQTRLAPVFDELISIYPEPLQLLSEVAVETRDAEAVISVPGILFANYAALLTLQQNGLDIRTNKPVKSLGHSQGVLAATVVDLLSEEVSREHSHFPNTQTQHRIEEIFAIAHIIGAATSWATRRLGIASSADITPMLSIRGLTEAQVVEAIKRADVDSVTISIQNNTEHFVLSGYPHQLKSVIRGVEVAVEEHNKAIKAKLRGGVPLDPKIEFLQVTAPFHSPLLESAYLKTIELAKACGLDAELTAKLANHILLQQVNWFASVQGAAADGVDWLVNLGPGSAISNITNKIVKGTGVTVVDAGAVDELTKLFTYGYMPKQNEAWSQFKPKLIQLPDGKIVVDTKFTRLTGLSPIMLPGMTPTTVNAPIVAAAANAGHWAEMAGGGQYDAKVFGENLGELLELLEPGRAVQFNTMFFDRYIWGLQFGSARIVPKARVSGAPIDGVCISAGIPNMEEATEIITTLRSEGFKYISFKPGTADQIEQCVKIANASPDVPVIIQVEDGRAGGHHSWVNLDETLLATYELVRKTPNLVLCVGGGIGKPERAADYLTGEWSKPYGVASMPVDGVFVGTVAMTALEAKTNEDVKRVLVETPGLDGSPDSDEAKTNLWVGSLKVKGGVTSSLSHLHADMYELANASAECARLLHEVAGDDNAIYTRREEIIAALNKTAKPYFGDAQEMTYAQLIDRYVELCVPWVDDSWVDRFYDLLQRVEARFCEQQYGKVPSLFRDLEDVRDASDAITRLTETYPQIANLIVSPIDAAWFIKLCRKHPKPIPFVAAIDKDLLRAWGTDSLWQSHDPRYKAEQVRVIPGPLSVSGVKTMNEPIGQLLGRFEQACVERLQAEGTTAAQAINRVRSKTVEDFLQQTPHIVWKGKLIDNPAYLLPKEAMTIVPAPTGNPDAYDLHLHLDTYWDEFPNGERYYAVRHHMIPLLLTKASINGGSPIVDLERLPEQMYGLLSAMAGVHSTTVTGDTIEEMPKVVKSKRSPWGELHQSFTITRDLGFAHGGVTANELPRSFTPASIVPDAILGPSWPAIYGALGSGIVDDYPVIEGLLNAVHLDHSIDLKYKLDDLLREGCQKIEVVSWCDYIEESNSGRIVHVREDYMATHPKTGETILIAELSERFAVRGRVFSEESPRASAYAGTFAPLEMRTTARRLLRVVNITSPSDMTAFAQVSGDYNPIHTSVNAAKMVGLSGPLVHGMWLSAAAQHVVSAKDDKGERFVIEGWTYNMYGLVDLSKPVEISVERVGHMVGGGLLLEVTCRINKEIVSKGTARVRAKTTTYVFPGQGIQFKGMGLDERAKSAAVDEVWRRADKHTRSKLGFSILAVVRDNPTQLVANGMTYFHPDGLLYLTQFTQVALATVGYAQIERMREANVLIDQAYYAGHSLGEYNALSSYGRVISLETMLELVFHRGSTMHNLVPRDAEGRSNYLLGALRPNQFGMSADGVEEYITELSESTGEFLQIINYNLAGQQYAVAGTIKGLKMLEEDAARRVKSFGGKSAFMLVPGVDVPFHSTVLHNGVDEFRKKLYELLPTDLTADKLIDQYVPNLVARPFTLTKEFAKSILDVVPSEIVTELLEVPGKWEELQRTPDELARILLIELLCWQFASPVRWIETQELFFKQLGVEQLVEIGLKESPTLANLAAKTLLLSEFSQVQSTVYNVQRDEARIYYTDSDPAVQLEVPVEEKVEVIATPTETEQVVNAPSASPIQVAEPLVIQVSGPVDDLTFLSSDGMYTLIAFSSKIRLDQIGETDTMETLTNGVSSRRNQLLMDISAELGLPSIDGAAEATIGNLTKTVESLAKNYKPFGTMLTEATRSHINKWFGQAGAKLSRIDERVKTAWGLGTGWVAYVTSEILLGTREGASMRDGDRLNRSQMLML